MRVEGRIFADERLIEQIRNDQAPEQVANVAFLPGIQMASLAMPDIHWGYGFCIGGVCATDPAEGGVVSPGGVGYDINCGVRLVRTNLTLADVQPRLTALMDALFRHIPAGVGKGGPYLFGGKELRRLLAEGCRYLESRGLATAGDLEHTEAGGCLADAEPESVSPGPSSAAATSAARSARATISWKCRSSTRSSTSGRPRHGPGSRPRLRDDPLRLAGPGLPGVRRRPAAVPQGAGQVRHRASRPAIGLCPRGKPRGAAVPGRHAGGRQFRLGQSAVADVANPRGVRRLLRPQLGDRCKWAWCTTWPTISPRWSSTRSTGKSKRLCVHRKGATRAFPPGHPELPPDYRAIGQPVIIPGDMGRASWVLVGQPGSMEQTSAPPATGRAG